MSTRPEPGSPDELIWLRGFEEARNHFLAENKQSCGHVNTMRKILQFSEEEREQIKKDGHWAPYTHQVVFCTECSRVVGQENNDSRKALS